jgi:trans-aconitate methyltransferase
MNWNAELYDHNHAFVFQYGESLLEQLNVQQGETILDLGCGTGHLTHQIQSMGAEVIGLDASPSMIKMAKENFPETCFAVGDATSLHFNEPFDAIFSNATLHWILNQDDLLHEVYHSLKPGGRFVVEMGGKGNVQKLLTTTREVLGRHGYIRQAGVQNFYFPSLGEYTHRLEQHGFTVTFAVLYDRPTQLHEGRQGVAKWLSMFGDNYFEGIPQGKKYQMLEEITDQLEADYRADDGQWYADYKRLRFIAIK